MRYMIGKLITITATKNGEVVSKETGMELIRFEPTPLTAARSLVDEASEENRDGQKLVVVDCEREAEWELLACSDVREDPERYYRVMHSLLKQAA